MTPMTVAHITHEAREKIGGIGSVLEGFITSPAYQRLVGRSILIGPLAGHLDALPTQRLGEGGEVLYSSLDRIDTGGFGGKFHPIEWAFNVAFVYGRRRFELPGSSAHVGQAEVLLIDVFNASAQHVNRFKGALAATLGIDSRRYEHDWGYEEYVRLAEPAFYALLALLQDDELPCILFAHEFMGLPTAFKAALAGQEGQKHFRTIFHAHECATARRLVEEHPGHDTAFYNILGHAASVPQYVDDVFGDQSDSFRHALVSRAHLCDAIVAVGDYTAQEMHFLGEHFDHHHIDLVYNGVPHLQATLDLVARSRRMLSAFAQSLLDFTPDVLLTHVTRPVISKGIWRDLQVCEELDPLLGERGQKGALFILTSAGGVRRPHDIQMMQAEYGWPRRHRVGYPDLVGPEIDLNAMVDSFNQRHANIQAILVNQFGWSRELVGPHIPEGMTFGDFRRAGDIEFGMATYEPFGISPLEPLGAGTICVISSVCGCAGFVEEATRGEPADNVIVADYTQIDEPLSMTELCGMQREQRDRVERKVAREIAQALIERVARDSASRRRLFEKGQELVERMNWDQVVEHRLAPVLRRILSESALSGATNVEPKKALGHREVMAVHV